MKEVNEINKKEENVCCETAIPREKTIEQFAKEIFDITCRF